MSILLSLIPGDTFMVNSVEYIVLEQLENNQTAVIRKELLDNDRDFDYYNNDWRTSRIRKFLNENYLKGIENIFGSDRIVEHSVDLLSLDGLDDYGTSNDKISLLTIDQYRKYRKVLGGNTNGPWWLATPDSTPSGTGISCVLYVRSDGDVHCSNCEWDSFGARPFFIIQS